MKGILLAGGSGTRLHPLTKGISKQLLPIYDKPMVYYPMSILMLAGIKDILIITTAQDLPNYEKHFGDGAHLGIRVRYKIQPSPDGLAQAFLLGEDFIGDDDVCLVLGDNVFYGNGLSELLQNSVKMTVEKSEPTIFSYYVTDPQNFGIVELDQNGTAVSIEEKPSSPKSHNAVVGLYFYPNSVIDVAKSIKPSMRGELEISSVNQHYIENSNINVKVLGRGFTWLDTGTHDSLLEASNFIKTIEKHTGLKVACLEEIAFKMRYINADQLTLLINELATTDYSKYLKEEIL